MRTRSLRLTEDAIRSYSRRGNYHSDPAVAKALGLPGLVAQGVQVAGPAYGELLDEWGEEFLARGTFECRFVGMVTEDQTVEAKVIVEGTTASFEVTNETAGDVAVVGRGQPDLAVSTVELTPHPWNTAFVWDDHVGPFTTITAAQARQYDELGFFVVEDAFDAEELRALDDAIAPGEAKVRAFLEGMPGGRFTVAGVDTQTVAPHLVLRSDVLRRFCAHPLLAGICRDLLGPDVRLYWEQAVYKQPHSAEPVLWHQDNGYTFVEPQSYLTCWVAITDATPENGCVTAMPGVHRRGTLLHRETPIGFECWGDLSSAVEVPVRAGSIVVFTSLTPHFTARNSTDEVRKAYIVQYAPDGAIARRGKPDGGEGIVEQQDDPARQFFVVRHGMRHSA